MEAEVVHDDGGDKIRVKCDGLTQNWYWKFEGVECKIISVPNTLGEPHLGSQKPTK